MNSPKSPSAVLSLLAPLAFAGPLTQEATSATQVSPPELEAAARVAGISFDESELELMAADVSERLSAFERLRARTLDNGVQPALGFHPLHWIDAPPRVAEFEHEPLALADLARPAQLAELYYADLATLAALIKHRRVSCVELTELFLARLDTLDPLLSFNITSLQGRARAQALALDAELAAGKWRGPLHGIPWGAKDLLAVRGYPTTWGAAPFKARVLDVDAAVVERLDAAGAVLIAKLTLGALAWGDVWFGGQTKNPWNVAQGSSGSSAGPASAVAAGAVPFAIGSETLGSIVSPSTRCGCSSLRPTFGRVSRHGAMALSWTMDKLGPICRSAADAALVFESIHGADARDRDSLELPFRQPNGVSVDGWRVGFVPSMFERAEELAPILEQLESLGLELVPVQLPDYPVSDMTLILQVEAAAAFDDLTRSGADDALVRQERNAWPNVLRHAHLIPAVEYVRVNRLRSLLVRDWETVLASVHALVHPSFAGGILSATNLSGHPTFVAPAGFDERGAPFSVSFTARLGGDDELLALVQAWQAITDHHRRQPTLPSPASASSK